MVELNITWVILLLVSMSQDTEHMTKAMSSFLNLSVELNIQNIPSSWPIHGPTFGDLSREEWLS